MVKTVIESNSSNSWLEIYSKKQLHEAQHSDGCLQEVKNWITTEGQSE